MLGSDEREGSTKACRISVITLHESLDHLPRRHHAMWQKQRGHAGCQQLIQLSKLEMQSTNTAQHPALLTRGKRR